MHHHHDCMIIIIAVSQGEKISLELQNFLKGRGWQIVIIIVIFFNVCPVDIFLARSIVCLLRLFLQRGEGNGLPIFFQKEKSCLREDRNIDWRRESQGKSENIGIKKKNRD